MNKFVKVLSLFAILSISSLSLAFNWGFTNITDKILVVQVKKAGNTTNFFNVVGPGQKTNFEWGMGGFPFSNILIGEYDETKAKNFPGTNASKLPKESGKNPLDAKKITSAIDARGEWFNSLDQMAKNNDPLLFVLDNDRWKNLINKINPEATKLANGTITSKQVMDTLKIADELKAGVSAGDVPSGSPLSKFTSVMKSYSRDFLIIDFEGKFALVAPRSGK